VAAKTPSLSSPGGAAGRILKSAAVGDQQPFQLMLKGADGGSPDELMSGSEPEKVLQLARIEADEIKKRAYDEGWREGYQEGLEQAREEAVRVREAARGVLRETEALRRQTLEELAVEVRTLAVAIAEKLVAGQLELGPETIAAVARETLDAVRERESVVLYVHPTHAGALLEAVPVLKTLLPEGASLRIIGDAGLERGGCMVETEQGLVDATTEVRWEVLRQALNLLTY